MSVASLVHSGETHIVGSYWSRVMGVKHRGQTVALFSIGHPHSIETYLGVGDMVCAQWPAILRFRSTRLPKRNTTTYAATWQFGKWGLLILVPSFL